MRSAVYRMHTLFEAREPHATVPLLQYAGVWTLGAYQGYWTAILNDLSFVSCHPAPVTFRAAGSLYPPPPPPPQPSRFQQMLGGLADRSQRDRYQPPPVQVMRPLRRAVHAGACIGNWGAVPYNPPLALVHSGRGPYQASALTLIRPLCRVAFHRRDRGGMGCRSRARYNSTTESRSFAVVTWTFNGHVFPPHICAAYQQLTSPGLQPPSPPSMLLRHTPIAPPPFTWGGSDP